MLLSLGAWAWRAFGLSYQSLWRDEVDTLRFASRSAGELLRIFAKPGENGPLFFLLAKSWLTLAGQSEFALRLLAVLPGVLAVPVTYALTRRLLVSWGSRWPAGLSLGNIPLMVALLMAVNPYLLWYSQEGKMYALLVLLVLGAHLAFLAALQGNRWWQWLLYLAMVAASALVHLLAVLVVPLHVVWFLVYWPRDIRRWLGFGLTLLLPLVPYALLVGWWQVRLFLNPQFQTGHPFVPLDALLSVLLIGYSQGIAVSASAWILAPVIFLALAGAILGPRASSAPGPRDGLRQQMVLLSWLLLPPLLLYAITLNKPLFTDRYLIWVLPAFAVLLAQGIAVVRRAWRPLGWAAALFLVMVGLQAGWRQSHTPIKSDFRAAAAFVLAHQSAGDRLLFQMPYSRHTFEYYAGPSQSWIDGAYTNNDNPPEQVAGELTRALGDAPAVWLIAAEEELWDRRKLVRQWLEDNGRPTDNGQFTRVEVIRYQMRDR